MKIDNTTLNLFTALNNIPDTGETPNLYLCTKCYLLKESNYTDLPTEIISDYKPDVEFNSFGMKVDLDEKHFDFLVSPDTENWKIELLNTLISENGFHKTIQKSAIITKDLIAKYKEEYFKKLLPPDNPKGRYITAFYRKEENDISPL